MKLGMPTLIELNTLEDNAKLCKELGLDFVEINMNLPLFQASTLSAEHLNKLKDKYQVFFTFHIPEDVDVAHLNDKMRAVNHEIVMDTLSLMEKVESSILNMHMNSGIYFTLPDKKIHLYQNFSDQYIGNIIEFRSKVDEAFVDSGLKICIENTGIFNNTYLTKAVDCLLESDVFDLTWDIGHDHSSGHLDKDFMEKKARPNLSHAYS